MPELNVIIPKIENLAEQLEFLGRRLVIISKQMGVLKEEIFIHQETLQDDIRNKQTNGHLPMKNGELVKLTDTMRESLSCFGKLKIIAKYEGLKREKDGIEAAVKALSTAQTGYQTMARLIESELNNLGRQP